MEGCDDRSGASTTGGTLGLVERVAALHRVELFACIPGRVLAAVAEHTAEVRVSPGEVMIEEGAVEAHLYALVHGRVRVHRGDQTLVESDPGRPSASSPRSCRNLDRIGDHAGADSRPPSRQGGPGRSPGRVARARPRCHRGARRATPRDRGPSRPDAVSDRPPRWVVPLDGPGGGVRCDARAADRPGQRDLPRCLRL